MGFSCQSSSMSVARSFPGTVHGGSHAVKCWAPRSFASWWHQQKSGAPALVQTSSHGPRVHVQRPLASRVVRTVDNQSEQVPDKHLQVWVKRLLWRPSPTKTTTTCACCLWSAQRSCHERATRDQGKHPPHCQLGG